MDVHVILYDGFDELDAVGPYEVFDHAREYGADLEPSYRTLDPHEVVTASHGTRVQPDGVLPDRSTADGTVLLVPGGGWNDRSSASAWAEAQRGELPAAIADRHAAGATVAGVCTGGMLLAAADLTDGRPAVTHAGAMRELRESGADVREARVVDDGDLLTAGGVTAGLDLALHLVERESGPATADRIAETIEYERRRDVVRGGRAADD